MTELALAQARISELEAALKDELDNWNPDRRPALAAENRELRLLLEQIADDGSTRATLSHAIRATLERLSAGVDETVVTGSAVVNSAAGEPVRPPEES